MSDLGVTVSEETVPAGDAPVHVTKKPLTIVEPNVQVTLEEMAGRVIKTREEHGELLQEYHKVWYNAPHTWHYTHFLGVGLMKCWNDLGMYQALISENQPKTIIETGTYTGASALWYAFLMDILQIEDGQVFTIDIDDYRKCAHPRITFIRGDSTDPAVAADLAKIIERPLMVSLDADHSAEHVYRELCLYAPMIEVGEYLIVEDTNISWVDTEGERGDRGARGGLEDYLREHPGEFMQDVLCERWLLTMNPGGWLRRVAPHQEAVR